MKQFNFYFLLAFFALILSCWVSSTTLAQKNGLKMIDPTWGYSSIENKDSNYFHFSAKFTGPGGKAFVFTIDNCTLQDSDGKIYKKPYIVVVGASKGSSTSVGSGVYVNKLSIMKDKNKSNEPLFMNTVKIDEPHGKFEFKFGEDGFFNFDFLWAVQKDFEPGRVKILNSFDLVLK